MGASELFNSCPRTRIRRCQAWRSSSRRARLRSLSTIKSWGRPSWRKEPRRKPQRPPPPGKPNSTVRTGSPSRQPPSPSSAAVKPISLSEGRAKRRSPARLTNFRVRELLKVKIATSISSMTVRRRAVASSAPSRCSRSVSLKAFTSSITSPRASSLRAPRARMEKSSSRIAARRLDRVCKEKTTRCRRDKAKPSQKMMIRIVSVQAVCEE